MEDKRRVARLRRSGRFGIKALAAVALVCVLWSGMPGPVRANNGLNLIGSSAEGIAMGGAEVAVSRDSLAIASNPAGLAQLERGRIDGMLGIGYVDTTHTDEFADEKQSSNALVLLNNAGVAVPLKDWGVTLGGALFAQGGTGPVYKNLDTAFGTRDELSSIFGIASASLGASIRVSETLSFGIAPTLYVANLEQRIFPDTSAFDPADPDDAFFGLKIDKMWGYGVGARFGALYKPLHWLSVGAAYATESNLDINGGKVTVNYEALGLGKVKYRNAKIRGFKIPREASLGVAVKPVESVLVSLQGTWIDWSSAMKSTRLKAGDPNNSQAPSSITIPTELNWRDQYVAAVGVAWEPNDTWTLRAGYNYAANPIPDNTLSPLLAQIAEHHITAGVGYRWNDDWSFNAAMEYHVPTTATTTDPSLPLGDFSRERLQAVALWLMTSYRW